MNLSEGVTGEFAVGAGKKAMYEPCMNKVHTSNVQINLCMYKSKKSDELGIEPMTSRMEFSHLNPFASSTDAKWTKLKTLSTTQPGGW
jgi:hypothetical protein